MKYNWNSNKLGANICIFTRYKKDTGKTDVVILEYDYKIGGFKEQSDYKVCETYTYNNREYKRNLPNNFKRYYRLLSEISTKEWEKAYKLF